MDFGITAAIIAGALLILLLMGLEIGWSIGIVALIGLVFFVDQPVNQLAWSAFRAYNSFTLTALPLFVLMGALIGNSGINEYLFNALDKWIGRLPGGLATSTIVGNALFGAMCGSTIAATATFGKIAFPEMEKRGYDPKLGLSSIAVGSILAPLIPPSILMIIYASWQGLSVVDLFAAGLIPGVILTILFILTIIIRVKLQPSLAPAGAGATWGERLASLVQLLPFMLLIIGVLGVIFGGIMTPTEASAMGAFLSIILTLAYRRLNWAVFKQSLTDAVRVASFGAIIIGMASALTHVFNSAGMTAAATRYLIGLPLGKYGILVLFFVMYLLMGMILDAWSMLFLTFAFVMPVIINLGFNPIWWGVIYVMAGEQSTVTPPFGLSLFVLHSVVPQHSIGTIVRGSLPFLIPVYINVALLVAFPQIALWLPELLHGI